MGLRERSAPSWGLSQAAVSLGEGTRTWLACGMNWHMPAARTSGTSPTVLQRELGKRLRELRNQHGLTVEDVAEKLLCSATKISRLETGARRPNPRDVRDLCILYNLGEPLSSELMSLTRGARELGWWKHYDDLGGMDRYIGLEQDATAITCYSMYYIPGLLQTADYARGVIKAIAPKMEPRVLEQRVEVRMRRQQLLEEHNPPHYLALFDEAALRRGVGGPAIMAGQFDKALDIERRLGATIQVIPFDAGLYTVADSNFVLLEFEDSDLSPIVFVEGLTGNQYLEREPDIARYREAIEYLRHLALSPRDSVRLITEVRKTHNGE
jgi:transcriptional regulator with XRE-family HTH domain